jgi:hypothetical protein
MPTLRLRMFTLLLCGFVTVLGAYTSAQIVSADPGTISGDTYGNSDLGFRYKFPNGWVVNKAATQEKEIEAGQQVAWEDPTSRKLGVKAPPQCTKNLLFVTQHPAGMPVSGFDSSVFLMAIDPTCLPDVSFPTSIKDRESIQRIAKQIVSHLKTTTVVSTGPVQLRAFDSAGRVMLEIKQFFHISIREPARTTTQSFYSSMLLMQGGRYWVLWRFVADTDYNLEKLRETKIFFDGVPTAPAETK